jgi:hypothetical protein
MSFRWQLGGECSVSLGGRCVTGSDPRFPAIVELAMLTARGLVAALIDSDTVTPFSLAGYDSDGTGR